METQIFFEFSSKMVSTTVHALPIDINIDSFKLINGQYDEINFPVIFKQEYGKKFHDILDTEWPSRYLISEKMKSILEENSLSGWQTYPIKLYDKRENEIFGYHGFSVIGQSGLIDFKKSEIIEIRKVPQGPLCRYYKGIFFDKWDESDFFIPKNTTFIFITKNAAHVLKENKITNIELEKLEEMKINAFTVELNSKNLNN